MGSDNGLSPGWHQAIIWTNVGILLIGPLETNFSEIIIEIHIFSIKKMHMKMSSGKWQLSCLGLNVLNINILTMWMIQSRWILCLLIPWSCYYSKWFGEVNLSKFLYISEIFTLRLFAQEKFFKDDLVKPWLSKDPYIYVQLCGLNPCSHITHRIYI